MSDGKLVDSIAGKITDYFPEEERAQIDPMTILMIISIIISVIRVIQECNKTSADVKDLAGNVSVMEKMKINRTIRKTLGISRGLKFGPHVYAGLVEYGKSADEQELKQLFNEIL